MGAEGDTIKEVQHAGARFSSNTDSECTLGSIVEYEMECDPT
jgi:hypothetical protein